METQRDVFFKQLYDLARVDRQVVLLIADCGAPSLDRWRRDIPAQIINVGIAEQNMISLAAGLALEGKKPYCYAIAPFASLRCLEQTKVDLCCHPLPVTIVGVGAGFSYDTSGPTHHATEDLGVMRALPNMTIFNPADNPTARSLAEQTYHMAGPVYVRLDRQPFPDLYGWDVDFRDGYFAVLRPQLEHIVLVATGNMVHTARKVAEAVPDISVIDLFRLKPVDIHFIQCLKDAPAAHVITLEEHVLSGGLGSIIAEIKADENMGFRLTRIGIPDVYNFAYGGREIMQMKNGLDLPSIVEKVKAVYDH
jgi:transketolase